MQNQKGFSLIELIVVMAIMGIATGIAVPVYNNMKPQIRLNGAARQVMGDLMWARMQAVSQNNRYRIIFLNEYQYQILDDDNSNGTADLNEKIITKDLNGKYPGITFNPVPSQNPIFGTNGLLHWPFGITITLENPHGKKSLTIARTGRVKIN
ncbi:type II secretion system protein [uncultured Candidatus Kuenenia sp.]|uniref:GspH/FimT family pseudopilin n=1 Tax=Candidatus Kuenenia sp. TaxID=2499824 RepID=UPI001E1401AA|nr:type II secretion system protein [uncultured Candidatus Kuenenia sp.]MBE7545862.1 type II secretion system protein [Planctomycetia bacterium]